MADNTTLGDKLYGDRDSAAQSVERDAIGEAQRLERAERLGETRAEATARDAQFTDILVDTQLDQRFVRDLAAAAHAADLAEVDGEASDTPEAAARTQDWATAARRDLISVYGVKQTETLLARTRKFVARHPKLAAQLDRRGIGERPEIVRRLVEHVHHRNLERDDV